MVKFISISFVFIYPLNMYNLIFLSLLRWMVSLSEKAVFQEAIPFMTASEEKEQVIVFTQNSDKVFIHKTLPLLRNFCKEKNIVLIEKEATKGLPLEITTTPALIFQNAKGRSIYSGRYTEWSSIVNFIRNSRFLPAEAPVKDCKSSVFIYKNGRTLLFAPLKITDLTGTIPAGFQADLFHTNMEKAATNALQHFQKADSACKMKTDRAFYMDMHPYRDNKGIYTLTVALFSQFSCITPIYTNEGKGIQGTDIEALFKEGTKLLEKEIFAQLQQSQQGDALSFVSDTVVVKTWEILDLALPLMQANKLASPVISKEIAQNWQYSGAIDADVPVLQFRFFAPLDRYIGEVKKIKGSMKLRDNQTIESGDFEVEMQSLTMGVADFDEKIHHKYIKADKYPQASFHFEQIHLPNNLQVGQSLSLPITGKITFMGKTKDLQVAAVITPTLDENEVIVLAVSNRFQLNIMEDYGIKGPDGPKFASENVDFFMNFQLKSK